MHKNEFVTNGNDKKVPNFSDQEDTDSSIEEKEIRKKPSRIIIKSLREEIRDLKEQLALSKNQKINSEIEIATDSNTVSNIEE